MIVVDASVAVKWFVAERGDAAAHALLNGGQTLVAPDFVVVETLNVLRRKHKQGVISISQYEHAAKGLGRYCNELVPSVQLAERAVSLALRLDHAVYDCAYLACAIQKNAQVMTADDALVRKAAANGLQAYVILL